MQIVFLCASKRLKNESLTKHRNDSKGGNAKGTAREAKGAQKQHPSLSDHSKQRKFVSIASKLEGKTTNRSVSNQQKFTIVIAKE